MSVLFFLSIAAIAGATLSLVSTSTSPKHVIVAFFSSAVAIAIWPLSPTTSALK